ncbi:MAG: transposase [Actinomycetes bacterium]
MEHRLRTPEGHALYKQRGTTVEPVFGQTKHNRGIRAFSRRGLAAADSEWQLINLCHNLGKLYRHWQRQLQQAVDTSIPVRIVPA